MLEVLLPTAIGLIAAVGIAIGWALKGAASQAPRHDASLLQPSQRREYTHRLPLDGPPVPAAVGGSRRAILGAVAAVAVIALVAAAVYLAFQRSPGTVQSIVGTPGPSASEDLTVEGAYALAAEANRRLEASRSSLQAAVDQRDIDASRVAGVLGDVEEAARAGVEAASGIAPADATAASELRRFYAAVRTKAAASLEPPLTDGAAYAASAGTMLESLALLPMVKDVLRASSERVRPAAS